MRLYALAALLVSLGLASVANAQVQLPRTGTLTSAQPMFCVNPTTAAVEDCSGGGGGGVVTGNQSNAGAGTTGSANLGTNAYGYVWNGAAWVQETQPGANTTIVGPIGTGAPAVGVTVTLDSTDASALQSIITNTGGAIPGGTNAIGSVTVGATTAGGTTPFHLASSAASTNATLVSTGAHTLYSLVITGTNTAVADVRIYDVVGSPTCSSATGVVGNFPVITTAGLQGGLIVPIPPQGMVITTGLAYCITGAVADNDNTNAPTGVAVFGLYK